MQKIYIIKGEEGRTKLIIQLLVLLNSMAGQFIKDILKSHSKIEKMHNMLRLTLKYNACF